MSDETFKQVCEIDRKNKQDRKMETIASVRAICARNNVSTKAWNEIEKELIK